MGKSKLDRVIFSAMKEAYSNTQLPRTLKGNVEIKFTSNGVRLELVKTKKASAVRR